MFVYVSVFVDERVNVCLLVSTKVRFFVQFCLCKYVSVCVFMCMCLFMSVYTLVCLCMCVYVGNLMCMLMHLYGSACFTIYVL